MKNKLSSAGIIIMALTITLILVGCVTSGTYEGFITDPKTEDFEGSWRYMDVGVEMEYSFSGSDFTFTNLLENSSVSGIYSFTAQAITFTAGDDTWTQTYFIRAIPSIHYLDLYSDENSHVFGRFIKEKKR